MSKSNLWFQVVTFDMSVPGHYAGVSEKTQDREAAYAEALSRNEGIAYNPFKVAVTSA